MGICDATGVDIAVEGILIRRARIVGDFYATGVSRGVVVDVEVRRLVEAMQQRPYCRLGEVVVDVCEAVRLLRLCSMQAQTRLTL